MNTIISHISTSSVDGGSAVSAARIHENLLSRGFSSNLYVGDKENKKRRIKFLTNLPMVRKIDKLTNILFNKMGLQYSLVPSNFFLNKSIFKSTIIQLYNIHGGFFQFSHLKRLSKFSRIVWRLSDYWSMTGHCAYPGKCEKWKQICSNCPDLKTYPSIGFDNTKKLWEEKRRIIKRINLQIVVPTKKLFHEVKQSPILGDKEIYFIPNGVDTLFFKPKSKKKSRLDLKIPNKFSVLFISHVAYDNYRKGTHILRDILNKFKDHEQIQFLVAGINSYKWKKFNLKNLITFDYNTNLEFKRSLYNSSNVILIPSVNENLPNVLLEAMSCGIPSISNDSGGINECVNENNGILLKKLNVNDFVEGISKIFKDKNNNNRLNNNCRKTILEKFSVEKEIDSYLKIYEGIKVNQI